MWSTSEIWLPSFTVGEDASKPRHLEVSATVTMGGLHVITEQYSSP